MTMQARRAAILHVACTGGLTVACVAAAGLLARGGPGLAWLGPVAVGTALLLYGLGGMVRAARARRWRPVRGIVIGSELREVFVPGKAGGHVEYVPAVRTQYSAGAGTHVTDRYSLVPGDFRGDRSMAEALLRAYRVGAIVDVYVDPAAPEVACLQPVPSARRRSQYLAGMVAGVLVLAIAIWVRAHA